MKDKTVFRVKELSEKFELLVKKNVELLPIEETWKQNETQLSEIIIFKRSDDGSCDPLSYWLVKEYNERAIWVATHSEGAWLDETIYALVHYIDGVAVGLEHFDQTYAFRVASVLPACDWVTNISKHENLN